MIQRELRPCSDKICKQELDDKSGDGSLEGFGEHDPAAGALADFDGVDSDVDNGSRVIYGAEEVDSGGEEVSSREAKRRRTQA